jgi:phosphoenolpyruvate carboxykinase (ATP)
MSMLCSDNVGPKGDIAFFGLDIPTNNAGVPGGVLNPRNTWADKKKYDETANRLVEMFKENFRKYASNVTDDVANVMQIKQWGACL